MLSAHSSLHIKPVWCPFSGLSIDVRKQHSETISTNVWRLQTTIRHCLGDPKSGQNRDLQKSKTSLPVTTSLKNSIDSVNSSAALPFHFPAKEGMALSSKYTPMAVNLMNFPCISNPLAPAQDREHHSQIEFIFYGGPVVWGFNTCATEEEAIGRAGRFHGRRKYERFHLCCGDRL